MNITIDLKENVNPNKYSKNVIEDRIESYEKQIKTYNGKDPLDLWSNYINFAKQLSLDERKEAGLKIHYLYQRCISKCQPCNYHSNEKFVKLFMEYNKSYETNPIAKFQWMFNHRYGLKQSDFYLEWAMLYEKDGQIDEAIKTIEIALKRSDLDCNLKLDNYYQQLTGTPIQKEQHHIEPIRKFAFNYNIIYPNKLDGEEFSFEECRAQIYYKAYELYKPKLQIETQKYIDEISDLKKQLETARNVNGKREEQLNENNSKRYRKQQDSTMFTKFDSSNFTNITHTANQTSFWQITKKLNDDEMDEDEDGFIDHVKCDDKLSERTMPPPPPLNELSTLNETNIILTLNGASNSISNSVNQNSYCRYNDDKKRISKMFHNSAVDDTAAESIVIFQDKIDETKDFSIFCDNLPQNQTKNQIETKKSFKKYTEDGSLFYYDANTTENNPKREPLKLLSKPSSQKPKFEMTIDQSGMVKDDYSRLDFNPSGTILNETDGFDPGAASTRFISKETKAIKTLDLDDFEPPVSSTCFIRPILKTNHNKDEVKESKNEIYWDQICDTFNNEQIIDKDLEKEKLLEFHLNANSQTNPEMNMSKLISEDCMTQATKWSNCITKFKNKQPNETVNPIKTLEKTGFSAQEISWDNESQIGIGAAASNDSEIDINFSLIKSDFKIIDPVIPEPIEDENEPLTSEKLDQTFKTDYLRLYFPNSILNSPGNNQTCLTKMVDDQIKAFDLNETRNQQLAERTMMSLSQLAPTNQNKTIPIDVTNFNETFTDCASELNLNETIIQAIRDPFSFDIKIRLLERGPIDKLKANKSYRNLCTMAPIIKKKMSVVLNDNQSYNIIEEIGKGAYAQIYLIQNKSQKDKKYALKVDRQATAWEYYITEIIHERLAVMSTEKMMQIDVMTSFVKIEQFMKFSDGCFSAMNYYKNGSLLNLINYHVKKDSNFPYWFVIYLTLEMLNIIDYLHKCKILHADIKADNFLVDQLPDSINYFVANKTKCLVLIDFNRSIDLSMLPSEAEFTAKTENKSLLCCEMKANKNWTYQIDFYGILSSIHCIIFKKYMNVFTESNRNKITNSFPRTFDPLFSDLFDTYLNVPSCQQIPNLKSDWIDKFVMLFKRELGSSFFKSLNYLKDLNNCDLTEFK